MKPQLRVIAIGFLFVTQMVGAQTNDELYAGLQLNFTNPGARSLAMGSAFTGRADDATAAYTNPAGLLWLTKPEASIEFRNWDNTAALINGGSAFGTPSQTGIDTGVNGSDFSTDTSGVSFLSYVIPRDGWAIGFYRHEFANYKLDVTGSQGIFWTRADGVRVRTEAIRSSLDLGIDNYGISGAYALTENIWIGAGLSYYDFEIDAISRRFATFRSGDADFRFAPADFSDPNENNRRRETGDDDDVSFNVGLFWRTQDDRWSAGLSYRDGPKFDYDSRLSLEANSIRLGFPDFTDEISGPAVFEVPDVFSAGISFRPIDNFTINLDYNHVEYSSLEPNDNYDGRTRAGFASLDEFEIDDADQVHLGMEYVLISKGGTPWSIRLGAWHDPDHQLRFTGEDLALRARFPEGDDETHITGGLGVVFSNLELNVAFDASDRSDVFSASGIYRF